jgi:hypothetical protein
LAAGESGGRFQGGTGVEEEIGAHAVEHRAICSRAG